MKYLLIIKIVLILTFFISYLTVAGNLYEWTDENGVLHITTEPPPEDIKHRNSKYKNPSAKKQHNEAFGIKPMDATDYSNRGVFFSDRGQYDTAITYFTKAIALDPSLATAYFNRGTAYAEGKDQHDKAISDFSEALEINPRYARACYNRGLSYYHKNLYDLACSDWERACVLGDCDGYEVAKRKGVCQ